jgi:hypothetical protein
LITLRNVLNLEFHPQQMIRYIEGAGHRWLTPVLTTWEAEMGRTAAQGQPRQIVHEIPFPK